MKLKKISEILDLKLKKEIAESWDNVGLLVGDLNLEVKKVLLSLELTKSVFEMAKEQQVDLIITHHPAIFSGLKTVVSDNDNLIFELIRNNIALYSAHTNFDAIEDGLNDYVVSLLEGKNSEIIKSDAEIVGICRTFEFEELPMTQFINKVKTKLNIDTLRFTGNLNGMVNKAAIVTGSGADYSEMAFAKGAQVFITGDLKYHYALDLKEKGMNIIDAGHFDTECVFPEAMEAFIKTHILDFKDIEFVKSTVDVNPFEYL